MKYCSILDTCHSLVYLLVCRTTIFQKYSIYGGTMVTDGAINNAIAVYRTVCTSIYISTNKQTHRYQYTENLYSIYQM